jgi:tetratricopeptide (TPR) repeat protein
VGNVITQLHRDREALNSLDLALCHNPEFAPAFYDKACCYDLQGDIDRSIENLVRALCLSTEEVRKHPKTDTDLDSILSNYRFQELAPG